MKSVIIHYGMPRRSGRYPWGSGDDPYQSSMGFLGYVGELRKSGMSDKEIAAGLGMSTRDFKAHRTVALNRVKTQNLADARRLKDKGWSNVAIAEKIGVSEASVRNLLKPEAEAKASRLNNTVNELKMHLDNNKYLDVSSGTELYMGVSPEHLAAAVRQLKDEGYVVHRIKELQVGTGHETTTLVLGPPGTKYGELFSPEAKKAIGTVTSITEDNGATYHRVDKTPVSIDQNRVGIRYKEDGGAGEDGLVYLRRGVDDISIGDKNYAQVRIAVDGTHYIKGVAVYKDGLPKGIDVMVNSPKSSTGNKLDVLKPLTDDPDLPFGSVTKPRFYEKGGKVKTSPINVIYEEGEWEKWDKKLASQVLSKQTVELASRQLSLDASFRQQELREIKSLTNPTVRKHLLEEFASNTDSAAVELQGAAMPRQETRVIVPVNSLKANEVYSPSHRHGETVVLIRFPHAGKFEIPQLRVNNRNKEAQSLISTHPRDAIAINSKVAAQLSGADFDGDTVLVIPNNDGKFKVSKPLPGLIDFDPKDRYKRDYKTINNATKQREMGIVSNLITDMTLRGASAGDITKAVRHSMVVIDSEKHQLDYKQSAIDNDIQALKKKYQYHENEDKYGGASTLISRAKSEAVIPERKPRKYADGGPVDKDTGELRFVPTGREWTDKKGVVVKATEKHHSLALTNDAHSLSSGTRIERVYGDYSNRLKGMANDARKTAINTPNLVYSKQAARVYSEQRASLKVKLEAALKNAPLERRAQRLANAQIKILKDANPDWPKDKVKTVSNKTLVEMRARVGAKKQLVDITPIEWEAIQAGAISNKFLSDIIRNSNPKQIKEYATPRSSVAMTPSKIARAKSMLALGYPQSEIADALGVSTSTLSTALN